ncbi:MAG: prolipoprotein diacylglyceryl transferase [Propionibacteriaceae bacterium]|nr:prolipoprotein diacylglyceryl transferase [Propionibacteriaceae bacterium]
MPLFIPSPSQGVWYLGPVPLRGYALSILVGIIVAFFWSRKRWKTTGGDPEIFENIVLVSIVLGVVGARLYWVVIEWKRYFSPGSTWYHIFFVWQGGLGIFGGITVGFLTAFLLARQYKLSFRLIADCVAPTFLLAQGIGRLGNWWNQELYGLPTTVPWALEIDRAHRVPGYTQFETFHPTFLYEMLWNFTAVAVLLLISRRLRLGSGVLFGAYLLVYALGRFWIELLRIDPVEVVAGLRINSWTTIAVALLGIFIVVRGMRSSAQNPSQVENSSTVIDTRSQEETISELS